MAGEVLDGAAIAGESNAAGSNEADAGTGRIDIGAGDNVQAEAAKGEVKPAEGLSFPDEYKDRSWTKKVKSQEDLYKLLDNQDKLIGKKLSVPDWDKATPKELEEFFNRVRPSDKEAYALPDTIDKENVSYYKDLFHKAGLSTKQAEELVKGQLALEEKVMEKMFSKDAFANILKEKFGSTFEQVGKEAETEIRRHTNAAQKKILDSLENNQLVAVYELVNNMRKEYGASESSAPIAKAGVVSADVEARRSELLAKLQDLKNKPMNTIAEKQALIKQYQDTFK